MAPKWHIPLLPSLRITRSSLPTNLYHMFYTPGFAPWRRDREQLTPNNPSYLKLMDAYQNTPKDTLRWQVVANTAVKEIPKAVMRERLRRRLREAFREALKQLGYDWHGRVLQSEHAVGRETSKDLKGTLEIHCRGRAGLDCAFPDLVDYAKSAVSDVVRSWKNQSTQTPQTAARENPWWEGGSSDFSPRLTPRTVDRRTVTISSRAHFNSQS